MLFWTKSEQNPAFSFFKIIIDYIIQLYAL